VRKLLVALLGGTLAVTACSSTVTPSTEFSLDPQALVAGSHILEPLPEEVRYRATSFDEPQIAVIYRDHFRTGIEGGDAQFIELIRADGTVIMDARLDLAGEVLRLPAGRYELTAYVRWCGMDACMGYVGERLDLCSLQVRLKQRHEYSLAISREHEQCDFAEVK
jgi:hypothetical protein